MRAFILLISCFLPMAVQAQSLEGRWLSGEWGGVRSIVDVAPCKEGLCGTIVDVRGGEPEDGVIGHQIFWGFTLQDDGTYSKGKLKPPGGAPQLNASIKSLSAEEMTIRACLLLICRNETMERL